MSDGIKIDEAVLVVLAITALLLSAAFLPTAEVFGGADSGIGEFLSSAGIGDDIGNSIGDTGSIGSPASSSLSEPPQQTALDGNLGSGDSPSPVPLFTVESPEKGYWRQTAYTSYTGTGWRRSSDVQPLDRETRPDGRTTRRRTVEYEVTLLTESKSLPMMWQPQSVDLLEQAGETGIVESTVGGVQSDRLLPEGSTYVGESSVPTRDPEILRRADRTAPAELRETYTQLPPQTPTRVGQFTDDLVADEETKYDTVTTVRDWLKSNKSYSLETPIDTSKPVADQLIFEVDEAYCQHFATTMAVMLRSQDIPARYVVGFAGGRSVGGDKYLVTGDRGHAWVEVFFEDIGWVRFDPTPGGSGGGSTAVPPRPPYDISLNRSTVVGAPVTVSVDKDDSGVTGTPIYINDERVGWTDGAGELTATLPYDEEITITARYPGSETTTTDGSTSTSVTAKLRRPVALLASTIGMPLHLYQLGTPALGGTMPPVFQTDPQRDTSESSETYTADTDATITVMGERTVGSTATVVVTIQDVAVTDATVRLDGQTVGTTNSEGYYNLSLADVEAGTHRLTASREIVETSTEFTVKPSNDGSESTDDESNRLKPNVSVSPTLIALPGGSATATVERDGNPIADTPVRVDGAVTGRTDANGTVGIEFPITNAVVVAASVNGVTGERSVQGLYRNAIAVIVALGGVVVGIGMFARRHGLTLAALKRTLAVVGGHIAGIPHRLTALIIRLADVFEAGIRGGWQRLRVLPRQIVSTLVVFLRELDPRGLLIAAVTWLVTRFRSDDGADTASEPQPNGSKTTGTRDRRRIQTIWRAFIDIVRPPKLTTRTPGEIGRYAVDRGLPQRPVAYLTELYRAVEYGRHEPDSSRIETAQDALSTVQKQDEDE